MSNAKVKNPTWTVTLPNGKTQVFERDFGKPDGLISGLPQDVFFEGLEKMRAAGAKIVEGER